MALKRINKELTDLGRYVKSNPSKRQAVWAPSDLRGGAVRIRWHSATAMAMFVEFFTDMKTIVILPPLVPQVPSVMTWYVDLEYSCAQVGGVSGAALSNSTTRRRRNFKSCNADQRYYSSTGRLRSWVL